MEERHDRKMISVCMCTYNGEKFIRKQLDSVRKQTILPDEVIICDDCSADRTAEIVEHYIWENKLTKTWKLYQNKQNKGYPGNFYYAMLICKGEFIFLADQDDLWVEDKIQNMTYEMKRNPRIKLLASKWGIISADDKIIKSVSRGRSKLNEKCERISVSDILYCYDWPGMSMCCRKELVDELVHIEMKSNLAHDIALALVAAEQEAFYCLSKVNQYHRRHDRNVALEEHRIKKNLDKKRKVMEIKRYLRLLEDILSGELLSERNNIELVKDKKRILQKRLANLINGKPMKILRQYKENSKQIRIATVVCDLLICRQNIETEDEVR